MQTNKRHVSLYNIGSVSRKEMYAMRLLIFFPHNSWSLLQPIYLQVFMNLCKAFILLLQLLFLFIDLQSTVACVLPFFFLPNYCCHNYFHIIQLQRIQLLLQESITRTVLHFQKPFHDIPREKLNKMLIRCGSPWKDVATDIISFSLNFSNPR